FKLKSLFVAGAVIAGISVAGAPAAWAFGGCVDSPENPTLLLALLGGAAAGVPWLRRKLKSRREEQND
ncbi:MAG: PExPT-CTERM protein, partial [Gammaproteobacteria bacterium]|nr:PExPT-CTERM protein [Gammaproteobacteria bacterium]